MKNILLSIIILTTGLVFASIVFAADSLPEGAIQKMEVNDKGVDENGVPVTEFILDFPEGGPATNGAIQGQAANGSAVSVKPGIEGQQSAGASVGEKDDEKFGRSDTTMRIVLSLLVIIPAFLFWLFWRGKKKKEIK